MTTEYEAKMLRDLNGALNDLLERMRCDSRWLIAFSDCRSPVNPVGDVCLIVSHRSIDHGNAMFRIDCAEVERIERIPDEGCRVNTFRSTTVNGFRVSRTPENQGDTEQESFDVLTARDTLAALYGFVICHHADALESAQRSENQPPQPEADEDTQRQKEQP